MKNRWDRWKQTVVTVLITVGGIAGLREGCGVVDRFYKIARGPETTAELSVVEARHYEELMSGLRTNQLALQLNADKIERSLAKLDTLSADLGFLRSENAKDHSTLKSDCELLKKRQKTVTDYIDSQTNHPPIQWPQYSAKMMSLPWVKASTSTNSNDL
jgi:hypothetical protein